eukprot:gene16838-12051_t
MKMCKDYWYHYSDVAVNKSTAVNFVNHTTLERDTPKAPPKKVTLIESMVKPRGLFIVDGVPVPRSELAAATRASLPTVAPLTVASSSSAAPSAHRTSTTGVTMAPMAPTRSLSHPRSLPAAHTAPPPPSSSSSSTHMAPRTALLQLREQQRRQASAHYTHIYHDNNFVRAPSQSAENPFTRLVLPGYAEHRSLQKRQAIAATETSKLSLITR